MTKGNLIEKGILWAGYDGDGEDTQQIGKERRIAVNYSTGKSENNWSNLSLDYRFNILTIKGKDNETARNRRKEITR